MDQLVGRYFDVCVVGVLHSVHQDGTKECVGLTIHLVWPKNGGIDKTPSLHRVCRAATTVNEHMLCLRWAIRALSII